MSEDATKPCETDAEKRYEVYFEERKILVDAVREGARSFDRMVGTLAAGGLGFSLSYMQLMGLRPPVKGSVGYLLVSWILLGVSLAAILLSFAASQAACREQIKICGEYLLGDSPKDADKRKTGKCTEVTKRPHAGALLSQFCGSRDSDEHGTGKYSALTKLLNVAALVALFSGIAMLAVFVVVNVPKT